MYYNHFCLQKYEKNVAAKCQGFHSGLTMLTLLQEALAIPIQQPFMSPVQWICLPSDRSPVDYRAAW